MISFLYRLADRARDRARRGQWDADLASGRRGEDLAHRFLRRLGFTVVARNYRPHTGSGEIDIVAWDKRQLVFVEVKTRATHEFGTPDRAVDREKQVYIGRAAHEYARRAEVEWNLVRFDIVGIVLTQPPEIELLRDAFHPGRTL
jgi:putative endonuclease